jgi:hypothetical protein
VKILVSGHSREAKQETGYGDLCLLPQTPPPNSLPATLGFPSLTTHTLSPHPVAQRLGFRVWLGLLEPKGVTFKIGSSQVYFSLAPSPPGFSSSLPQFLLLLFLFQAGRQSQVQLIRDRVSLHTVDFSYLRSLTPY